MGDNLKVFWAKLSTLSLTVKHTECNIMANTSMPTSRVENSAQVLSCLSMTEVNNEEEWGLGVDFKLPQPNIFVIFLFIKTSTRVQS